MLIEWMRESERCSNVAMLKEEERFGKLSW